MAHIPYRYRLVSRFTLLSLFILTLSCHGHDNRPLFLPVQSVTPGVPINGAVTIGSFNRYAVSVIPGTVYKISITGLSDDVDLLFYGGDAGYSSLAACSIDNTSITGLSPEDCVVSASGSSFYFLVDGGFLSTPSGRYRLDVEPVSITGLNLSLPILDSTIQTEARIYAVAVTPGGSYTIALTELNDNADLFVFRDAALGSPAGCSLDNRLLTGSTPEDCTLIADTAALYFVVDGLFGALPDILFTAFAAPAPAVAVPADQGTPGTPLGLFVDNPAAGQVGFNGTSYYSVAGLLPGTRYTVGINGLTNNADLTVYNNDSTFSAPSACSIDNTFFTRLTPEDCALTASGTALYFTVTANTNGASYLLLVEPGP